MSTLIIEYYIVHYTAMNYIQLKKILNRNLIIIITICDKKYTKKIYVLYNMRNYRYTFLSLINKTISKYDLFKPRKYDSSSAIKYNPREI